MKSFDCNNDGCFNCRNGSLAGTECHPAARAVQISDSERELPFKGKRAYSTISQLSEAIGPRIAGTAAEKRVPY